LIPEQREPRPRPGQVVAGLVEDLAYGGAGILRADGWVVMVRGAFPQDRIQARVRRQRKGLLEADLVAVVAPGPDRVPPRCPHLPVCGGCALQGLAPAAQTACKARQATELLRRIGRVEPECVVEPWSSPKEYFYRNKMEFTFGARPWLSREELDAGRPFEPGPALGLHPRGQFQGVFNIEECRLQSPESNRIVCAAREAARELELSAYDSHTDQGVLRHLVVRQAATTRDLLVVVVARSADPRLRKLADRIAAACPEVTGIVASINLRRQAVAQGDHDIPLLGEPGWRERVAGVDFRIGASSFFQTQTLGGEALVEEVLAVGGFSPERRVLDLYCGIGAFSLPIARRAGMVLGVEVLPAAVAEARASAAANGIENAAFVAAPVEAREPQGWESAAGARAGDAARSGADQVPPPPRGLGGHPWDVVVVDPPRAGLHPRALARVLRLAPPRIVYVSCNPATLARDAGALIAQGAYVARRLRVFDLFPQTPHLESVLVLDRT
jgi:23S rRNA (uracil1939-C5)-methyltransferase